MRARTWTLDADPFSRSRRSANFLVWLIVATTGLALTGGGSVLGFGSAGVAWFLALAATLVAFPALHGRVTFPVLIWIPWALVVIAYVIVSDAEHSVQRGVMTLCPIFVGATVSKMRVTDPDLAVFGRACRLLTFAMGAFVVVASGLLLTGALPDMMLLAGGSMTAALIATYYSAAFVLGDAAALYWWVAACAIPVVAVTRMGILATGATLPLTLAPMRRRTRVVILSGMLAAGLAVFQSDRVQQKMFYSGSGSLRDLTRDTSDLATSGRRVIWESMWDDILAQPWLGHGANSSERYVLMVTGGQIAHPHNDWLRLLYEYGIVGTTVFLGTLILQLAHLVRRGRASSGHRRLLFFAGASSFIVFLMFMVTDNIVLYAAFFGNLHFTMMGLAYAADASARASAA